MKPTIKGKIYAIRGSGRSDNGEIRIVNTAGAPLYLTVNGNWDRAGSPNRAYFTSLAAAEEFAAKYHDQQQTPEERAAELKAYGWEE